MCQSLQQPLTPFIILPFKPSWASKMSVTGVHIYEVPSFRLRSARQQQSSAVLTPYFCSWADGTDREPPPLGVTTYMACESPNSPLYSSPPAPRPPSSLALARSNPFDPSGPNGFRTTDIFFADSEDPVFGGCLVEACGPDVDTTPDEEEVPKAVRGLSEGGVAEPLFLKILSRASL